MRPTRFVMILSLGAALVPRPAVPCCAVPPTDKSVVFGDQTNIVIWNPVTHMEHFVRNAMFQSDAKDFGFIAPTPSKPELSEAATEAFTTLAGLKPPPPPDPRGVGTAGAAASPDVEVIQAVDVAGYHATTLLANDAHALAAWMNHNGYVTSPGIEEWTKVYIAKGWYLTAFKVTNQAKVASTGTIRMSFKADRPFNPFYVPKDNMGAGPRGVLKVYFVSDGLYDATVGRTAHWQDEMWHASVPAGIRSELASQLKLAAKDIPENAQVQAFEDDEFPHAAGDDIFFKRSLPKSATTDDGFVGGLERAVTYGAVIGAIVAAAMATVTVLLRRKRISRGK